MALTAKHRSPDLRLEGDLIVLAAMVANDLKAFGSILPARCLLSTAFWAPLRRRQIPLIEDLLFLFSK